MTRTTEQQKALNDAIRLGVSNRDDEMLRLGLEKGGNPDLFITEANNSRRLADQKEDLLLLALKKGADANSLLFAAIEAKAPSVARLAIEQGSADVNCSHVPPGKSNSYPIAEWSYRNFSNQISELLFEKGMNVDMPSADGTTALMRACNDEDYNRAMHYLGHGANPFLADSKGGFPLRSAQDVPYRHDNAFYENKAELVRAMLKNVPDDVAEDAASSPRAPFNTVATANDVSVNHPLELKKPPGAPEKPAKGFSL